MSTATMPEVEVLPEGGAVASEERPKSSQRDPLFNEQQQKAFDRAFSKREKKVRAEYGHMRSDLLDTCEITLQLLERCRDRISVEDECAIRDGLQAMRSEYGGVKWQKQPK